MNGHLHKELWRATIACLVGLACVFSVGDGRAASWSVQPLLEGVQQIASPGVPGTICVFGPNARAVVSDRDSSGACRAVVAAARYGRGRVVVFGHTGYLDTGSLKKSDTARLLLNAVRWAAGSRRTARVGVLGNKPLAEFFRSKGLTATVVQLGRLPTASVDVIVGKLSGAKPKQIEWLARFLRQGGGLIAAETGWGWQQIHRRRDLRVDNPANRLLAPMGLVFAREMAHDTAKDGFVVNGPPPQLTNAALALDAYSQHRQKRRKLTKAELTQVSTALAMALNNVPPTDRLVLPRLRKAIQQRSRDAIPSQKRPVRNADVLAYLAVMEQTRQLATLPPEKIKAHPAAAAFPGAVPKDAPRVTREIAIDTSVPRWHSTGLYAAPGQVIEVALPAEAAGKGLRVRIGAHKDKLWGKPVWKRCPDITREFPLAQPVTQAACAFGGLVYIVVPHNCSLGTVPITIRRAVEAPFYQHGVTDLVQWRERIRHHPAPWAELATRKIVLTVQSKYVRDLDDPKALMDVWDQILDACADLATIPRERPSPERIVLDVQISAGWLHAGYPIMGYVQISEGMVSHEHMRKGDWGFFHELGHNHQNPAWTFSGTGEVTCNLFTLYVYDKVCGVAPNRHPRFPPEKRRQMIRKFLQTGEKPPFTFLLMYMQMQEAFGWEAFQKVFAEYRALPPRERPKTDAEKRDQWLIRFSRTVGRNLGPFFEAWRVETSPEARRAVANLPVWMPPGFPPKS